MTNLVNPIQFVNEYTGLEPNVISGQLVINLPFSHQSSEYSLHWANDSGTPIQPGSTDSLINRFIESAHLAPLADVNQNSTHEFHHPLYYYFDDQIVPLGATTFAIYGVNKSTGQSEKIASKPIFNEQHLLPSNATPLEQKLDMAANRISDLPLKLGHLWDVDQCPEEFLPWLGWGLSVNGWVNLDGDDETQETYRRRVIRNNAWLQKHNGTKIGIIKALEIMGVKVEIKEWWEEYQEFIANPDNLNALEYEDKSNCNAAYELWAQQSKIPPYGFIVSYDENLNSDIESEHLHDILLQTITELKPVRSRFKIEFNATTQEGFADLSVVAHTLNSIHFSGDLEVGVPIQHVSVDKEIEVDTKVKMRPIAVVQIAAELDLSSC